nr:retrovirus-related Pol polyprotein from transposon TNT 1-94 [Tanacetum cinerariifolium]
MHALLIQHGCEAALDILPADMEAQAKAKLNKKAHSVVILCLGNKVLREITEETTAAGVWSKLETLYMTKLLADRKLTSGIKSFGLKIFWKLGQILKVSLIGFFVEEEAAVSIVGFQRSTTNRALEILPADMEAQEKAKLNKKAHSAMILCLGNKVLREVTEETTAAGVWSKLETLYMTKSLANKLYTFYMPAGQKIS